jgi:hypothetical protein
LLNIATGRTRTAARADLLNPQTELIILLAQAV